MRILFTRFPLESAYGGAEVLTIGLMDALVQRGHAVAFLGSCPVMLRLCRERGIPAAELHIGPPPVSKWTAVSFLWRKGRMRKTLTTALNNFHSIDAVFMLSLTEKLLLTDASAEKTMKVFWMEHDRMGRWLTKNPWLPMLREKHRKATTIAVSELSRTMYVQKLRFDPKRIVAVHNGIEEAHITSDATVERPQGGSLHIGTVARLTRDKGVDVLLLAIRDIPDVTLDIVGRGRDAWDIERLVTRMNTQRQCVRIFPDVPEGIGAFYKSLDVFVLPSREHDPCPLAPAEAMTHGIATIMTEVCGTAGYVHDGKDALVIPADDVEALKEAIVQLKDPVTRKKIAEAGKNTALQAFSFNRMVDHYEKLIREGTLAES
ncbi:glycosyltransferase family 4 protein [Candidatus Peregrinibacteria bacterium]|nr:glycosyltransferase family 4 protein [Candidatus Peregrinibacteria bacterium]